MLRQDKKYMAIYLPHFSWLAAIPIALSSITTPVAAAELKVLSIGDGDTIRVSSPSGTGKTNVRLEAFSGITDYTITSKFGDLKKPGLTAAA